MEWVDENLEDVTSRVIAASIAVHRALGPGFLEPVYHRALEVELRARSVRFEAQVEVVVRHLGVVVGRHRLDMVVEGAVVLELKAVDRLAPIHYAQLRSYLRATGIPVGLLLNFAESRTTIRRIIVSPLTTIKPPFPPSPSHLPRSSGDHAEAEQGPACEG